ncbi:protein YopX [Candidatus Termititenax aidoneus]|uniref:Protein YopX n=1 Tax=Termititenax aidoneus TaxID=2218524 RepID=A0A388TEC3_TERA1|nr:protein YopX [Candidatus Termititenax aidoneus]
MREIKFRGKELKTGKWVYGFFCIDGDGAYIINDTSEGIRGDCINVDRDTVGQYTGLDDKNDNEIFEGDILKFGLIKDNFVEVVFGETGFNSEETFNCIGFYLTNHNEYGMGFNWLKWQQNISWEVVGNIHDDPELLKKDKEQTT